jgi:hypothetical protein
VVQFEVSDLHREGEIPQSAEMRLRSDHAVGLAVRHQLLFSPRLVALQLPKSSEVILSLGWAIPTRAKAPAALVLNGLRMARGLHYLRTDEVARNGVLQRITSARGFL